MTDKDKVYTKVPMFIEIDELVMELPGFDGKMYKNMLQKNKYECLKYKF